MQREALLLSVRPTFVERILDGTKTAELRRVRPTAHVGQDVLIYASSPTKALLASAVVERIETQSVESMWHYVRSAAGVSRDEYDRYFKGAEMASALWLRDVTALEPSVPLSTVRERWPWFRPPQSYCFVRATFEGASRIGSLAPRLDRAARARELTPSSPSS